MAVTASRLGNSPITWDWTHFSSDTSAPPVKNWESAWAQLKARFEKNEVGFFEAPINKQISQLDESVALAQSINASRKFSDCLFLGIGGSSLGPLSMLSALQDKRPASHPIRFHFAENPDPMDWNATLQKLNPETTFVCAVTKSGTTFETLSQLLIALEWLGKPRWKSHVVCITDPQKGDLLQFAKKNDVPTLFIAPPVGGRFSIFTPVGLFPLALAGLSTEEFMKGAATIRDYADKTPAEKNPFFIIGQKLVDQFESRPIHVCMPYSTRLRMVGDWFVQLWGESLGKDGKGFTPLAALGAIDQHSILQLLRDGPDDKVTWFVTVDKMGQTAKIPSSVDGIHSHEYPAFARLQGHTLESLLKIEYQATSLVLAKRKRPHMSIQLDSLDEKSMGALYFAFSVLTAFTGTLWGVDPFDQPGVEEGKVYTRESLDRIKQQGHS